VYLWRTERCGERGTIVMLFRLCWRNHEQEETVKGQQSSKGETILLVDDNEAVRTSVGDLLRLHGYKVLAAGHAEEAIGVCSRHAGTIHLLITDIVMPGISGEETAIRIAAARPGIKVLYLSGYTMKSNLERLLEKGAVFLQKPAKMEALLGKIRELLDQ
jgi:two-component system cell cycle sensor histidine kinase/response regulator CckA